MLILLTQCSTQWSSFFVKLGISMKDISSVVMEWVTYIGGISVLWSGLVAIAGMQIATILKVSETNIAIFRLTPYVLGGLAGYVLLTRDTNGVLVGVAMGMVAALLRNALLFWLLRDAAKPWMKSLGAYLKGNIGA